MNQVKVAIVADFDPANRSHAVTNEAIQHSAIALGLDVEHCWIWTDELRGSDVGDRLREFGGVWIGPASPYKSMEGALQAIRIAREGKVPLLGTCGGFQHIILEYARNVLGIPEADHEETTPGASQLFISRLACSLVDRTMTITLQPDSLLARLYGRTTVREEYHCNYGVNPKQINILRSGSLHIVASDNEGEVRAVELPDHPFFAGTLFLPQHLSTSAAPHPVISGFLQASRR
jgi:CTP synthase (UTP-ammonia lyase)